MKQKTYNIPAITKFQQKYQTNKAKPQQLKIASINTQRGTAIYGNWKMNPSTVEEAVALSHDIMLKLDPYFKTKPATAEVGICPPSGLMTIVNGMLLDSRAAKPVQIGAQNIHHEKKGAFTGEMSASLVKSLGASCVIIGHSERRGGQSAYESNKQINQKLNLAIDSKLLPIFCIGETLKEKELGKKYDILATQLFEGLKGLKEKIKSGNEMIIAYEPVWAIGTGKTATSKDAQDTIFYIRRFLSHLIGIEKALKIRIQYGGSMNEKNAMELLSQPDIDGGLIGGASLKAPEFSKIVQAADVKQKIHQDEKAATEAIKQFNLIQANALERLQKAKISRSRFYDTTEAMLKDLKAKKQLQQPTQIEIKPRASV